MLMTRKELAAIYKVHANTIDNWRKLGMPTVTISGTVRFDEDEVSVWIRTHQGREG